MAMKVNWKNLAVVAFGLLIIISTACSKEHSQNVITGVWKVVNVADILNPNSEKWEFLKDGRLNIYFLDSTTTDTLLSYNLKYNIPKYNKLEILATDSSSNYYCRSWEINKLNRKVMIINFEDKGLLVKEFEKE